jgi:deoxyribonuclease-1-like protein
MKRLLAIALLAFSCAKEIPQTHVPAQAPATYQAQNAAKRVAQQVTPAQTRIIAEWNLNIFGEKKLQDKALMELYASKLKEADITVLQEIRDKDDNSISELCGMVDTAGYDCLVTPRTGRTASKEQYCYVFKRELTITDHHEIKDVRFERNPYVATFNDSGYIFTIHTIHTKPTDTRREMVALEEVVSRESKGNNMVIGDLNADCKYFRRTTQFSNWLWAIPDDEDTTAEASTVCAYDRFIMNPDASKEFVEYGIDRSTTRKTSDHYRTWIRIATHDQ